MIHRANYLDVISYLDYQVTRLQNDAGTVNTYWSRLRHLLEWADEQAFTSAPKIKPSYPVYLERMRKPDGGLLGAVQFTALCKTARAFFAWGTEEHPTRYRAIDANWIQSIRPSRARSEQAELKDRTIYQVEEVVQLATANVERTVDRRTQAAVALLFLSGMRIGAFSTLPIACVDLANYRVLQLPEQGVRTKNRKAAVTTLLRVPELMRVAMEWDEYLRKQIPENCLWYAHLSRDGEVTTEQPAGKALANRRHTFADELRKLCGMAGVSYKSAHKFRHGHAVYALKRAKTVEQLKAISQNLMHSTIGITDGIYGNLVQDDVHNVILGLGEEGAQPEQDLEKRLEAMLRKMLGKGE